MPDGIKKCAKMMPRMNKLSSVLWMAALVCLVAIFAALADERLPVLKVGSEVYSNVTVTSVSTTDIFFMYSRGIGNAKLKNLEPAMQQHFHYNPDKASVIEQQQREANAKFAVQVASNINVNTNKQSDAAAEAQADLAEAISQVQAIINQPVKQYPEQEGVAAAHLTTWFQPGATLPDFKNVDIRATQETNYAQFQYVVCDLNPGVVFLGDDIEFNRMTKYFYTDRALPKKN